MVDTKSKISNKLLHYEGSKNSHIKIKTSDELSLIGPAIKNLNFKKSCQNTCLKDRIIKQVPNIIINKPISTEVFTVKELAQKQIIFNPSIKNELHQAKKPTIIKFEQAHDSLKPLKSTNFETELKIFSKILFLKSIPNTLKVGPKNLLIKQDFKDISLLLLNKNSIEIPVLDSKLNQIKFKKSELNSSDFKVRKKKKQSDDDFVKFTIFTKLKTDESISLIDKLSNNIFFKPSQKNEFLKSKICQIVKKSITNTIHELSLEDITVKNLESKENIIFKYSNEDKSKFNIIYSDRDNIKMIKKPANINNSSHIINTAILSWFLNQNKDFFHEKLIIRGIAKSDLKETLDSIKFNNLVRFKPNLNPPKIDKMKNFEINKPSLMSIDFDLTKIEKGFANKGFGTFSQANHQVLPISRIVPLENNLKKYNFEIPNNIVLCEVKKFEIKTPKLNQIQFNLLNNNKEVFECTLLYKIMEKQFSFINLNNSITQVSFEKIGNFISSYYKSESKNLKFNNLDEDTMRNFFNIVERTLNYQKKISHYTDSLMKENDLLKSNDFDQSEIVQTYFELKHKIDKLVNFYVVKIPKTTSKFFPLIRLILKNMSNLKETKDLEIFLKSNFIENMKDLENNSLYIFKDFSQISKDVLDVTKECIIFSKAKNSMNSNKKSGLSEVNFDDTQNTDLFKQKNMKNGKDVLNQKIQDYENSIREYQKIVYNMKKKNGNSNFRGSVIMINLIILILIIIIIFVIYILWNNRDFSRKNFSNISRSPIEYIEEN